MLPAGEIRGQPQGLPLRDGADIGSRVHLRTFSFQADEVRSIAARIDALVRAGTSPTQIAVLFRRQRDPLATSLESELRRLGVPCASADTRRATSEPMVRATIDLLRYLAGTATSARMPDDSGDSDPVRAAFRRFLDSPLADLPAFDLPALSDACLRAGRRLSDLEADGTDGLSLPADLADAVDALLARLTQLRRVGASSAGQVLWHVWTIFPALTADALADGRGSRAFRSLLESASRPVSGRSPSVDDLLRSLDAGDLDRLSSQRPAATGVAMLTVHAAKGWEWDYVFVPGLVDRSYPLRHSPYEVSHFVSRSLPARPAAGGQSLASLQEAAQLAEERRVFYVALTRARRDSFLSYSAHGPDGGSTDLPSRFLASVRAWPGVEAGPDVAELPADTATASAHYRRLLRATDAAARAGGLYALDGMRRRWPESVSPDGWWDSVAEPADAATPFPDGRLYLTASRLSSFRDCPLRYQFSYHWRLGEAEGTALTIGNVLHAVLKEYHEPGSTVPRTLDGLYACLDRWFDPKQFDYRPVAAQSRRVLREALAKYFRLYGAGADTLAVETGFSFHHEDHTIAGRFDRVDRLPDATLEIIDYKSGKSAMSYKEAEDDLQLALYDLAFHQTPELAALGVPSVVNYLYPRDIGATARGHGKRGYAPSDESRDRLRTRVDGYADAILGETFPPYRQAPTVLPNVSPEEAERLLGGQPCRTCMYEWICESFDTEARGE